MLTIQGAIYLCITRGKRQVFDQWLVFHFAQLTEERITVAITHVSDMAMTERDGAQAYALRAAFFIHPEKKRVDTSDW